VATVFDFDTQDGYDFLVMEYVPGGTLESRLDPAVFFRASRRHLINVRLIEHVELAVDDSYTVRLRGGLVVPVSRRQSRRFREQLGL